MNKKPVITFIWVNLVAFWLSFFLVRLFLIYTNDLTTYLNTKSSLGQVLITGALNDLLIVLPFSLLFSIILFFRQPLPKVPMNRQLWLVIGLGAQLAVVVYNFFDALYFSFSRTHFHYWLVQYIIFARFFADSVGSFFTLTNGAVLALLVGLLIFTDFLLFSALNRNNVPVLKLVKSSVAIWAGALVLVFIVAPKVLFPDQFVESIGANSVKYLMAKDYCYRSNIFSQLLQESPAQVGLEKFRQYPLPKNYAYINDDFPLAKGPQSTLCQAGVLGEAACSQDVDKDGYPVTKDCDDTNSRINPGQKEVLGNGIDEDCDGIDNARPNVILIVMESFGASNISPESAPFVTQLKKDNTYFNHFYSNGTDTIRSVISSLCSVYTGQGTPEVSPSKKVNLLCLPEILQHFGYHTMEFQAGDLDFLDKREFYPSIGFQQIAGKDELSQGKEPAGWGINDKDLYRQVVTKLDQQADQNFFLTLYTISIHDPYPLPADATVLYPHVGLANKVKNLVRYSDDSLKVFFDLAKDKPWFKNSLIVITADNGQPLGQRVFNSVNYGNVYEENIWTPLIVVDNARKTKQWETTEIGSQVDIAPTILDYLGVETVNHFQGKSLLSSNLSYDQSFAFSLSPFGGCMAAYHQGDYKVMSRSFGSASDLLFDVASDPGEEHNLRQTETDRYAQLNQKSLDLYFSQYYLFGKNRFWSNALEDIFRQSPAGKKI